MKNTKGFAEAFHMHKTMLRFIDSYKLPKKAFIVCTSGVTFIDYVKKIRKLIQKNSKK